MEAEWLDETDCVGLWRSAALAAVVFPTADTLSSLRQLAGMVRNLCGTDLQVWRISCKLACHLLQEVCRVHW